MTNQNTRRGFTQIKRVGQALPDNAPAKGHLAAFTLIELLVVVLIIGILAAVAVPQYQVAVNKSRFAKLRVIGKTYINAMQVYYLENGTFPDTFDKLIVDKPAGTTLSYLTSSTCAQNDEMYCCLKTYVKGWQSEGITCARKDYSFGWSQNFENSSLDKEYCAAETSNENAVKLCASLGTYVNDRNLVTPQGHTNASKYKYKYYVLHN